MRAKQNQKDERSKQMKIERAGVVYKGLSISMTSSSMTSSCYLYIVLLITGLEYILKDFSEFVG